MRICWLTKKNNLKLRKKTEISSTSSENEREVDDSKEDQAKAAKEECFDKHKKSKRKCSSLYLNETIEPIVLESQAKRSKVQRISKNSKAFQDKKRKLGKQNRSYTQDTVNLIKQLKERRKNLLSKKLLKF